MGAVERAEFSNHVAHVIFDRAFRDTEFVGDLLVAPSGSEVTQYIQFAPGKGLSKGLRGFSLGLMGGQAREVVEEFCRLALGHLPVIGKYFGRLARVYEFIQHLFWVTFYHTQKTLVGVL